MVEITISNQNKSKQNKYKALMGKLVNQFLICVKSLILLILFTKEKSMNICYY